MANFRPTAAAANAMLDALARLIDGGTIKLYTASQPANAATAIGAQTLLGTLTLSNPSTAAASGGVLTFSAITSDSSADATGTATWARWASSGGTTVFDSDAATSGATITLNTASIVATGVISCSSATLTISLT